MRPAALLALLVVALLAGCSFPFGGGDAPVESVTPADVPTPEAPVSVGSDFAPILSTHRAALNATAYTFRAQYFAPTGIGETSRATAEGYFTANSSAFYLRISRSDAEVARWSNGTVLAGFWNRSEDGARREYSLRDDPSELVPDVTDALIAPELRRAVVTRVVDRERGYEVRGELRPTDGGPDDRPRNGTVVVRVSPSGLLQRYELRSPAPNRSVTITFSKTDAPLPRPEWLSTAFERATAVEPMTPRTDDPEQTVDGPTTSAPSTTTGPTTTSGTGDPQSIPNGTESTARTTTAPT